MGVNCVKEESCRMRITCLKEESCRIRVKCIRKRIFCTTYCPHSTLVLLLPSDPV